MRLSVVSGTLHLGPLLREPTVVRGGSQPGRLSTPSKLDAKTDLWSTSGGDHVDRPP